MYALVYLLELMTDWCGFFFFFKLILHRSGTVFRLLMLKLQRLMGRSISMSAWPTWLLCVQAEACSLLQRRK